MVDQFLLHAVKEASKEQEDEPDFDLRCKEHAEKLERFIEEYLNEHR